MKEMNQLPAAQQRIIRKSSYGRTQLFLPTKGGILREVKCMGGITKHNDVNVYHLLPEIYKSPKISCWHCCETIKNVKECIPIPRYFDSTEKVYHVFGATCSPGCAKAYTIEHTSFDRGHCLNVLTKMFQDVYQLHDSVTETPPRPALVRFGGIFDPKNLPKTQCTLVEPPFISYCMLAEERVDTAQPDMTFVRDVEEADTFDEPQPPAMFNSFLESRTNKKKNEDKRHRAEKSEVSEGPMAKFVKR
jgi:hypothetical protein